MIQRHNSSALSFDVIRITITILIVIALLSCHLASAQSSSSSSSTGSASVPSWSTSDWSDCKNCSSSTPIQSRLVTCSQSGVPVSDSSLCTDTPPSTSQSCQCNTGGGTMSIGTMILGITVGGICAIIVFLIGCCIKSRWKLHRRMEQQQKEQELTAMEKQDAEEEAVKSAREKRKKKKQQKKEKEKNNNEVELVVEEVNSSAQPPLNNREADVTIDMVGSEEAQPSPSGANDSPDIASSPATATAAGATSEKKKKHSKRPKKTEKDQEKEKQKRKEKYAEAIAMDVNGEPQTNASSESLPQQNLQPRHRTKSISTRKAFEEKTDEDGAASRGAATPKVGDFAFASKSHSEETKESEPDAMARAIYSGAISIKPLAVNSHSPIKSSSSTSSTSKSGLILVSAAPSSSFSSAVDSSSQNLPIKSISKKSNIIASSPSL